MQNIAEKYSMQKLPRKIAKKIYEKINGKHFNLLPLFAITKKNKNGYL